MVVVGTLDVLFLLTVVAFGMADKADGELEMWEVTAEGLIVAIAEDEVADACGGEDEQGVSHGVDVGGIDIALNEMGGSGCGVGFGVGFGAVDVVELVRQGEGIVLCGDASATDDVVGVGSGGVEEDDGVVDVGVGVCIVSSVQ